MRKEILLGADVQLQDGLKGSGVVNFATRHVAEGYTLGGWSDDATCRVMPRASVMAVRTTCGLPPGWVSFLEPD